MGLFGYRREDVLRLAGQIEQDELAAHDQFAERVTEQESEVATLRGRLAALDDVLLRLRADREHLERLLALARDNSATLEAGTQREVDRLNAEQGEELARLREFLPRLEQEIAGVEGEVTDLAHRLDLVVRGDVSETSDAGSSGDFADVAAALLERTPKHFPVRRLPGGRTVLALPEGSARLQVRGGAVVASVVGLVVSPPPHRVLGFAVEGGDATGVVPAADVAALRQGIVLVRDKYRLVAESAVPDEATRAIFPVTRPSATGSPLVEEVPPARDDAADAADFEAAGQRNVTQRPPEETVAPQPSVPEKLPGASPEVEADAPEPQDAEPAAREMAAAVEDAATALEDVEPTAAEAETPGSEDEAPATRQDARAEVADVALAAPAQGDPLRTPTSAARSEGPPSDGDRVKSSGEPPAAPPAWPEPAHALATSEVPQPDAPPDVEIEWPEGVPMPVWQLPDERPAAAYEPPHRAAASRPQPTQVPPPEPPRSRPPEPPRPRAPEPAHRPVAAGSPTLTPGLNILAFLQGKVVGRDIVDGAGNVLAARGASITADLVELVDAAGMLPEMIVYMTLPEGGG